MGTSLRHVRSILNAVTSKGFWAKIVTMLGKWKARASALKRDSYALYLAARDPRVPKSAKLVVALVVGYALSPVDLIPDFIPLIGYLDDFVLLPLGFYLAIKLIPEAVWDDCRRQAAEQLIDGLPRSRTAAIVVVSIWVAAAVWLLAAWL